MLSVNTSHLSGVVPFSFFFFTPLFKVMSLIYTVDEYESSVCSIVHFVFLAFPLSKVMSLI